MGSAYRRLRIQVFAGIFVGYAGYYLVRKNFSLAMPYLIDGPVILIGLHALDLVPKKAAGTAAGLTGLFGYFGGAFAANIAIGAAVDHFGWNGGVWLLFGSCLISVGLFAVVWKMEGSR